MSLEKFIEIGPVECGRVDIGSAGAPPRGRRFTGMKANPAEEARISKNQCAFCLVEHKVIVFLGMKAGSFNPQLSSHAEMEAKPVTAGEFEQHLFPP